MKLETNIRYRIEVLMRCAKLTTNDSTREDCIAEVRDLLDEIDIYRGDEPVGASLTKSFAADLRDDEILGKTITEISHSFLDWAGDDGEKLNMKEFKAEVSVRGLYLKPSWVEGKTKRVFCRKENVQ